VRPMFRLATKQADLFALQPTAESASSRTDANPRRIGLPSDLSASLKYLDNDELERLREAISSETNRRGLSLPRPNPRRCRRRPITGRCIGTSKNGNPGRSL
jgi:hypothetical protein